MVARVGRENGQFILFYNRSYPAEEPFQVQKQIKINPSRVLRRLDIRRSEDVTTARPKGDSHGYHDDAPNSTVGEGRRGELPNRVDAIDNTKLTSQSRVARRPSTET